MQNPNNLTNTENKMKKYIGTKLINAKPMTRQEYNDFRGWKLPDEENGEDNGYLVEYIDGGKPNTEAYKGYVSWSPAETFEKAYREVTELTFSQALESAKKGHKISRKRWNGKGMFVFLVKGSTFKVNRPPLLGIYQEGTEIKYHAHLDMRTATGEIVPWIASQTDVLSEDWMIVE